MAELGPLSKEDMTKLHAALTNAGIGEGSPAVAKLTEQFSKQAPVSFAKIICSSAHYCVIIKQD